VSTSHVTRVVTSGKFEIDGGSWDVDNNIWVVGDDSDVVVFDAAHTAQPIIDAVAGRNVVAVICTHGHNDHVTVAPELGRALDAPVLLHPADHMLWQMTHPGEEFNSVEDGVTVRAWPNRTGRPAYTRAFARLGVLVRPRTRRRLLRRHSLPGWTRSNRSLVLRLPDHPRLDS